MTRVPIYMYRFRFAPENHLGAQYESNTKGERLIARGKESNRAGVLQVGPDTKILKNQNLKKL